MKISNNIAAVLLVLASVSSVIGQVITIPPIGAIPDWDGDGDVGEDGYGAVYSIDGEINTNPDTWGDLSADFRIDFLQGDATSPFVDMMVVTVANTSVTDSLLGEFFIRKPGLATPSSLDNDLSVPDNWSLIENQTVSSGFGNYFNDLGVVDSQAFDDQYFGAKFGSRLEDGTFVLPEGGSGGLYNVGVDEPNGNQPFSGIGQFFFQFDEGFAISDWTDTLDDGDPIFFVKWYQVLDGEQSGKGYGGGDGFPPGYNPGNPPVPEPSEVALLAMLGLGGLLWGRKRLIKARAAK